MGGKPKVVKQDPEGDALRAANKATAEANAKRASRRSANSTGSSMSVLGGGEDGDRFRAAVNSMRGPLFGNKSKLGGGE